MLLSIEEGWIVEARIHQHEQAVPADGLASCSSDVAQDRLDEGWHSTDIDGA